MVVNSTLCESTRASRLAVGRVLLVVALMLAVFAAGCRSLTPSGRATEQLSQSRQLSQQGLRAMERGNLTAAETYLREAIDACPIDTDARRHYAEVLWQRNLREQALAQAKQAAASAPDDLRLAIRLGEMQLSMQRYDEARSTAEIILDADPTNASAWALRGQVSKANGELEEALADFQRALEYRRDDRQVLWETAELYRQLNRPSRALATLNSLSETYGPEEEPQQLLYLRGLALGALGRPDDAADAYALALARGPATPELLYRLGEAQLAAGNRAEADRFLAQALAADPNHSPSNALRARMQMAARPLQTPAR